MTFWVWLFVAIAVGALLAVVDAPVWMMVLASLLIIISYGLARSA